MRHVAVVGAGPAGLYATRALARAGCTVTLINRDLRPGGLAEYGIFYTKHKMKAGLRKQFERILAHDSVHYLGGVTLRDGGDLSTDDLAGLGFDAVLICVGAQGVKPARIDGSHGLSQVYDAKELVYHYNGLPPWSGRHMPYGERLVIIGAGNVAVDIAHWAVLQDIPEILFLVRRGPLQRKYTDKELSLVGGHVDREALRDEMERIAGELERTGTTSMAAYDALTRKLGDQRHPGSRSRITFRYATQGAETLSAGRQVAGLRILDNRLELQGDRVVCRPRREGGIVGCDTLVFAVGDAVDPALGLPLDEWDHYEVVPDAPYRLATDWPGWFVGGWARRASDGLVGKARKDAELAAARLLEYLGTLDTAEGPRPQLGEWLAQHGIRTMDWPAFQQVRAAELAVAAERGLPDYRFETDDALWSATVSP